MSPDYHVARRVNDRHGQLYYVPPDMLDRIEASTQVEILAHVLVKGWAFPVIDVAHSALIEAGVHGLPTTRSTTE